MTSADRKLDAWKKKLLDLGKRNRLINYHDTKRSNLRIIKPGLLGLWNCFYNVTRIQKRLGYMSPREYLRSLRTDRLAKVA